MNLQWGCFKLNDTTERSGRESRSDSIIKCVVSTRLKTDLKPTWYHWNLRHLVKVMVPGHEDVSGMRFIMFQQDVSGILIRIGASSSGLAKDVQVVRLLCMEVIYQSVPRHIFRVRLHQIAQPLSHGRPELEPRYRRIAAQLLYKLDITSAARHEFNFKNSADVPEIRVRL